MDGWLALGLVAGARRRDREARRQLAEYRAVYPPPPRPPVDPRVVEQHRRDVQVLWCIVLGFIIGAVFLVANFGMIR